MGPGGGSSGSICSRRLVGPGSGFLRFFAISLHCPPRTPGLSRVRSQLPRGCGGLCRLLCWRILKSQLTQGRLRRPAGRRGDPGRMHSLRTADQRPNRPARPHPRSSPRPAHSKHRAPPPAALELRASRPASGQDQTGRRGGTGGSEAARIASAAPTCPNPTASSSAVAATVPQADEARAGEKSTIGTWPDRHAAWRHE